MLLMEHGMSRGKEHSIASRRTSDAREDIIVESAKHNTDPIKALELPNSLVSLATCFYGTERHSLLACL